MQTSATDYFTGLRDSLTGLALDIGRAKLIDVERSDDDRYIYDGIDLSANQQGTTQAMGLSIGTMLLIGVVLVVGVVLAKRVL
jgi:hypothetical protein